LTGDATRRFDRLHSLVDHAVNDKSVPFTDLDSLTLELWDRIMEVNLAGLMRRIPSAI
jgi:3-oxoacyl-[acyl-carrier protein] reductase